MTEDPGRDANPQPDPESKEGMHARMQEMLSAMRRSLAQEERGAGPPERATRGTANPRRPSTE